MSETRIFPQALEQRKTDERKLGYRLAKDLYEEIARDLVGALTPKGGDVYSVRFSDELYNESRKDYGPRQYLP